MKHTAVRCCWRPSMPARATPERVQELGMRGDYGRVTRTDVHPEVNWRTRRNPKLFATDAENLAATGVLADVLTTGYDAGTERTQLEKEKKGLHRARMTQGGHGALGSEFYDETVRAMPHNSHQFKVRKKNIHEDWEVARWNGKYEAMKRTMHFENTRHPFFMYNRIFDRVLVSGDHCPIEVEMTGSTCTVWLTTTYVQGVTQLDFDLARFIDKERELMKRVDWTPVVRKTYEDGQKSYELPDTVEQRDLSQTNMNLTHKQFLGRLTCDWAVGRVPVLPGADIDDTPHVVPAEDALHASTSQVVHSWTRAMDVVNNIFELSEQVSTEPAYVRVVVNTVKVCVNCEGRAGRFLTTAIDGVLFDHGTYLNDTWMREKSTLPEGDSTDQQRGHLADTNPAPSGYFVKNPLGKGHGPIRKVLYDVPADDEAFQNRLAWGSLTPQDVRKLQRVVEANDVSGEVKKRAQDTIAQHAERMMPTHAIDAKRAQEARALRRNYKRKPDVLDMVKAGLQKNERLRNEPSLE